MLIQATYDAASEIADCGCVLSVRWVPGGRRSNTKSLQPATTAGRHVRGAMSDACTMSQQLPQTCVDSVRFMYENGQAPWETIHGRSPQTTKIRFTATPAALSLSRQRYCLQTQYGGSSTKQARSDGSHSYAPHSGSLAGGQHLLAAALHLAAMLAQVGSRLGCQAPHEGSWVAGWPVVGRGSTEPSTRCDQQSPQPDRHQLPPLPHTHTLPMHRNAFVSSRTSRQSNRGQLTVLAGARRSRRASH